MHSVSIRTKIQGVTALSIILVVALLCGIFVFAQAVRVGELRGKMLTDAVKSASTIAYTIAPALIDSDFTRMGAVAAHFGGDSDYGYVAILDRDGTVLAHSGGREIGRPHETPAVAGTERFQGGVARRFLDSGVESFEISHPIRAGDLELGSVRIGLKGDALKSETDRIASAILISLGAALAISVIGIAFASTVARRISAPVQQLKEAAESIGRGDYDHPVTVQSDDEIGLFADAFRSMARDLKESRAQLVEKAALQASEKFIRGVLDSVGEGMIVIDPEYRILQANRAYCEQAGCGAGEIIGRRCYESSPEKTRPCHEQSPDCPGRRVFETGEAHAADHRYQDAAGMTRYLELKAYPIKDAAGTVTSAIETVTDVTEKHLLEEERLKTQKLESIGTLAGGIAHDFNNLLQGIFGYISLAKETVKDPEQSLAMLEQAEEALHLSVNLTTQLLTFSKGGKPVKSLLAVGPVVENAAKFALSGSHTRAELDVRTDVWPVEADEGQLSQVIQNIVLNADDAMAGGGTVQVSVANVDLPPDAVVGLPDGGQFVRVTIRDSGCGIPEQHLARIFDPYFTTKQKGSGLGLAASYSIVRNHGGVIEAKSDVGSGTVFTIWLPASRGAEARTAPPAPEAVGKRTGRILLMDDEELVRNLAERMIAGLGHDVVSAADGEAAIALYRQAQAAGSPFDLAILDLTVKGGMGGEETIKALREIDPAVKAIVSSGYADSPVLAHYREHGFSAALNKPYRIGALRSSLGLFFS